MFNLFKKQSPIDKLNDKYKKLLADSHRLSATNRKESDRKYAEADEVLKQIEALNKQ
ncbi:Lacal_2735 family protein [Aureibaculum sp. A20]|uniref:Lacal_2735 family protein n=1 Tax=Aureibaculum flavum TaxID=2795986 RepID=A0ABS0WRP3_9FLAO|nr:Lacal_2735 family protein [Aureibaculum flavum]MBJ2174626.1 Lacal_2735 family protein [Aureibaculum flavum]